jgi:hypothetical protein
MKYIFQLLIQWKVNSLCVVFALTIVIINKNNFNNMFIAVK